MVNKPAAVFFILGKVKEKKEQPLLIKEQTYFKQYKPEKNTLLDAFVHLNNFIIYYHISRNMLTNP